MPKYEPINSRFFKHFKKSGGCWLWLGAIMKNGYGVIGSEEKRGNSLAHRVSWEIHNGPIPKDMCVLHKCDVRACVKPDHLFIGTQKDNAQDMISKGRKVCNPNRGEKHHLSILTEKEVIKIRELCSQGWTQALVATEFGVNFRTISYIVTRKTWTHI